MKKGASHDPASFSRDCQAHLGSLTTMLDFLLFFFKYIANLKYELPKRLQYGMTKR